MEVALSPHGPIEPFDGAVSTAFPGRLDSEATPLRYARWSSAQAMAAPNRAATTRPLRRGGSAQVGVHHDGDGQARQGDPSFEFPWGDVPAIMRSSVTTPGLLARFDGLNSAKDPKVYRSQSLSI